jgi:hypothetical protein
MALLRTVLLKEYLVRLEHWREQLELIDPADMEKLLEARLYVNEYERMIDELRRSEPEQPIGVPQTLGGDGKPVLDC